MILNVCQAKYLVKNNLGCRKSFEELVFQDLNKLSCFANTGLENKLG